MENSTTTDNTTPDETDEPSKVENAVAGVSMLVLSLTGFIPYISVIYVILKHSKTKFNNSFYPFVVSLAFSDCGMLLLFIFYAVSHIFSQTYLFGETVDIFIGGLCNTTFYSSLPCIIFIGLNRYWGVCRWSTYEKVFSRRNVTIMIVCIWAFGIAVGVSNVWPGFCYLRFYPGSYAWAYNIDMWGCYYIIVFERVSVGIVGTSLIVAYGFIFLKRREQNKVFDKNMDRASKKAAAHRQKTELRLALNFLIVAVYLVIFDVTFTTLPEFTFYRWHNFITSVMYILNCSINPFIYIAFNKAVKNALKGTKVAQAIGKFGPVSNGTVVPMSSAKQNSERRVTVGQNNNADGENIQIDG